MAKAFLGGRQQLCPDALSLVLGMDIEVIYAPLAEHAEPTDSSVF